MTTINLPDGVLAAALMASDEDTHQINWFKHWGGNVDSWQSDPDPEIRAKHADAMARVTAFREILATLDEREGGD